MDIYLSNRNKLDSFEYIVFRVICIIEPNSYDIENLSIYRTNEILAMYFVESTELYIKNKG